MTTPASNSCLQRVFSCCFTTEVENIKPVAKPSPPSKPASSTRMPVCHTELSIGLNIDLRVQAAARASKEAAKRHKRLDSTEVVTALQMFKNDTTAKPSTSN